MGLLPELKELAPARALFDHSGPALIEAKAAGSKYESESEEEESSGEVSADVFPSFLSSFSPSLSVCGGGCKVVSMACFVIEPSGEPNGKPLGSMLLGNKPISARCPSSMEITCIGNRNATHSPSTVAILSSNSREAMHVPRFSNVPHFCASPPQPASR